MLTKDDIDRNLEFINTPHCRSFCLDLVDGRDRARELMRLALLGLAVVESGVTLVDCVMAADTLRDESDFERMPAMLDALAAALRELDDL